MIYRGFTLVELSIVLVIIGLLIGGILVGQSLIESAKINAQIKQFQQFTIAASNFKIAYKTSPGDSSKISVPNYLGTGSNAGNNDGTLINGAAIGNASSCATYIPFPESFLYFPQLSVTGMLKDRYSNGLAPSNVNYLYQPGLTTPKAAIGNTGIYVQDIRIGNVGNPKTFYYLGTVPTAITGDQPMQNYLGGAVNDGAVKGITTAQSAALDSKIDDGIANSGNVVAINTTSVAYSAGCGDYSVTYNYPGQLDTGSKYHAGCNLAADNSKYDLSDKVARCRLAISATNY